MQPHTSYLICATPRSGSTLLCEALTNTKMAGHPKEYFEALKETGLPRRPVDYFKKTNNAKILNLLGTYAVGDDAPPVLTGYADYATYLISVLQEGTTPNGVFGAKVMWGYLEDFVTYLREIPGHSLPIPQLFSTIFPNLHYIHVTRRDKVRQAISLWKAIQTWTWKKAPNLDSAHDASEKKRELLFYYEAIDHLVMRILAHEEAWENYFKENHIQPFRVVYEELAEAYEETALQILHYLGLRPSSHLTFAERHMKQQADTLSEQWVQSYYQIKEEIERN